MQANINMASAYKQSNMAFTLAEVLITLGIVGVVAALTIPALLNNIQDVQYKTAYKKAFSVASQAYQNANRECLMVETEAADPAGYNANFLTFMDQFIISKKCINLDAQNCWQMSGELWESGGPWTGSLAFIDNSGFAWITYVSSINNHQRTFLLDTNSFNPPNQYGKDRFGFRVLSDDGSNDTGFPVKVIPTPDNNASACLAANKCAMEHNYYGTSWLYK